MLSYGFLHLSTGSEGSVQLAEYDSTIPPDGEELVGAPLAMAALASAPRTSIPNIFIVDDNPGDVELLRIAFEMSDFVVHIESAADGLAALQRLEEAAARGVLPDLVLLDLNMPLANGLEVLGAIRRDRLLNRIPVVVLSTSGQIEDRRRCLQLGAREFHTKPEHIRDLVRLVQGFHQYLDSATRPAG